MVFLTQYLFTYCKTCQYFLQSLFFLLELSCLSYSLESYSLKKNIYLNGSHQEGYPCLTSCTTIGLRIISNLIDDTALLSKGLQMEREDCLPYSVGAVLLSAVALACSLYKNNQIIQSTIKMWIQIKKSFNLNPLSLHLPFTSNPSFRRSCLNGAFIVWTELGVGLVKVLKLPLHDVSIAARKVRATKKPLFRYLQI